MSDIIRNKDLRNIRIILFYNGITVNNKRHLFYNASAQNNIQLMNNVIETKSLKH